MKHRRRLLAALLLGACVAPAFGAPFSPTPVRLVVGFSAGGAVDVVSRILASRLSERLETAVIVDNKPGFSGNLGAQAVAKAVPDGTTLLMAPVTSYAVTEAMMGKATGFALESDLVPVAVAGEVPLLLVVNSSVPANNMAEYIALAKANPGTITFASSGNGSTEHVAAAMFQQRAAVTLQHIPYKGGNPAVTDLIGGQVQSMFVTIPNVLQNLKSGRMKPLAIMTPARNPALPQVPTSAEAGLPGLEISSVYVIMAPAATPPAVLERLNNELSVVLKEPETIQKIAALGVTPGTSTLAEAKARTHALVGRWKDVVKTSNIKAQ